MERTNKGKLERSSLLHQSDSAYLGVHDRERECVRVCFCFCFSFDPTTAGLNQNPKIQPLSTCDGGCSNAKRRSVLGKKGRKRKKGLFRISLNAEGRRRRSLPRGEGRLQR